jgi:hypothetical protein
MQGFLAGGVCFAKKPLRVGPQFQILAFPYSSSINHSK